MYMQKDKRNFKGKAAFFGLVAIWLGAAGVFADNTVAVVGGAEAASIIRNLAGTGTASFEQFPDGLPAEDFSKYSLVILTTRGPKSEPIAKYSPADSGVIEEYVSKGGRLLLIQQAPKLLLLTEDGRERPGDYLYGKSIFHRNAVECAVLDADAPLLKGVLDANPSPHWLNAVVTLPNPAFRNLIGNGEKMLVGYAKFGKGTVYYVGNNLSWMQLTKRPEEHADAESWKTLLTNIILDAQSQ